MTKHTNNDLLYFGDCTSIKYVLVVEGKVIGYGLQPWRCFRFYSALVSRYGYSPNVFVVKGDTQSTLSNYFKYRNDEWMWDDILSSRSDKADWLVRNLKQHAPRYFTARRQTELKEVTQNQ